MTQSNLIAILLNYGTVKEENGKVISLILEDDTEIAIERIYENTIIDDNATYIYTKKQLEAFRDNVNNGKTYENEVVMLMNDIDLQGNENDETTWWTPIGSRTQNLAFKGTFNGNYNNISGIYIYEDEGTDTIGFWGVIANAVIKNVTISGTILANGNGEGVNNPAASGLVGYSFGKSLIENCRNEANVSELSGSREAVGILGGISSNTSITSVEPQTTIKNCSNIGNITGGNNCAGIAGYIKGKLIVENCYNEGTISNTLGDNTGGLIAKNVDKSSKIVINNCYNVGIVEGTKFVGGCIGQANGPVNINAFYNTGAVTSTSNEASGVIGFITVQSGIIEIANAYNIGDIKGYKTCGGIIGYSSTYNTIVINNTYNIGNITSESKEAGGIIGDTDSTNYLINVYNTGNCISKTIDTNLIHGSSGGIIGSCYSANTKITIINAYNIGDIKADKYASGIIGGVSNYYEIKMANLYNKGSLEGKTEKYGITVLPNFTEVSENYILTNTYYIDNVEMGSNLENDNTIKISEEYIKSEEFIKELNEYVEKNPVYQIDSNTSIKLSKWKLGENGYPVFQ